MAVSIEYLNKIRQQLYVAAVCDILDEMGYRNQAMHQRLRPLLPDIRSCGFIGKARTLRWMEMDHTPEDPYEMEIAFMDSLQTGDVAIHSTDSAGTNAPWGELMSTVAQRNGAAGCVCDSQIRDCVKIIELGFPVYYTGIRPLDSKGRARVMAYDIPVKCGDVLVKTGDIIFADFDGIVVVPEEISEEVFRRSAEKINSENLSRKELMEGKTLRDVYEKYHAL